MQQAVDACAGSNQCRPQVLQGNCKLTQINGVSVIDSSLYCVECSDGQRLVGYTNGYGNTERVFTDEAQSVVVRWGRDAANYLNNKGINF